LAAVFAAVIIGTVTPTGLDAQTLALEDPVLRRIWREGMENSHLPRLAQALLDSVGPRLTGSPGQKAANDWAVAMYASWGIAARNEQYGTWRGWRRGITHVDLIKPRVRSLEATMLAWSPGTGGKRIEGQLAVLPEFPDSAAFVAWLPEAKGRFVLVSFPQPTCRPDAYWEKHGTQESVQRMKTERDSARARWSLRRRTGMDPLDARRRLDQAGALGLLESNWSNGWGVNKIFQARTEKGPSIDLSCEDYGLLYRLAENRQSPVIRVEAEAEFLGEVPTYNTIAEIPGTDKPSEYVMLSAHFDSWDASSGATDNGTGSVTMMEAMRILKTAYPQPKRTILAGHWSGEEQGLNGSRAFVADHPEIVQGLQALFNQDNGTGRVVQVSAQGLVDASAHLARWFARLPNEITRHIRLEFPGIPGGGGSDYASFICSGAPGFSLSSTDFDYDVYTWHTNRDTYDKLVFDDLKNNATLAAMLAYLAAEDPERVPRARRELFPVNRFTGQPGNWPQCRDAQRASPQPGR
jgi:hypothetical protein